MSANDKGPNHYKSPVEHWDVVQMLGWDYLIGAATKYLWRLGKKHPSLEGQIEDLTKAIHYLEKKLELLKDEQALGGPGPGYVDQDR